MTRTSRFSKRFLLKIFKRVRHTKFEVTGYTYRVKFSPSYCTGEIKYQIQNENKLMNEITNRLSIAISSIKIERTFLHFLKTEHFELIWDWDLGLLCPILCVAP